jgi:hypothetical protein
VIGVSKRCCPACHAYLKFLSTKRKREILIRGNHGTVSACTLPPWTPIDIVESMNAAFALRLRQDLVTLMEDLERSKRRNRCTSTGSETLSLDSAAGSVKYVVFAMG